MSKELHPSLISPLLCYCKKYRKFFINILFIEPSPARTASIREIKEALQLECWLKSLKGKLHLRTFAASEMSFSPKIDAKLVINFREEKRCWKEFFTRLCISFHASSTFQFPLSLLLSFNLKFKARNNTFPYFTFFVRSVCLLPRWKEKTFHPFVLAKFFFLLLRAKKKYEKSARRVRYVENPKECLWIFF